MVNVFSSVSNFLSFAFLDNKKREDFLLCQKFSVLANHSNLKWLRKYQDKEVNDKILVVLNQSFLGRTKTRLKFYQKRYISLWIRIMETYLVFCDIKSKKKVDIEAFRRAQSEWRIIVKLMECDSFNYLGSVRMIEICFQCPCIVFPPTKIRVKPLSFDLSKPFR